jgi:histidinol-phosphate aminotransferase
MTYPRPPLQEGALRLHLNENTAGCSPAVLDAIRGVTAAEAALYPDYAALARECAGYLGVPDERLVLTNGLDEGLLAAVVACFRVAHTSQSLPEAIIVQPTYEMYAICIRAAGGRAVAIAPKPDFEFPLVELLHALTRNTRLIVLNSPNNPTGRLIPREAIRGIAQSVPSEVMVLLDEAYYDFCGETFLAEIDRHPNVVVARTFAKAHGLAGLRAGCLIGDPERLDPIREVIPPYNLSVFTVAGWRAALRDRDHVAWYRAQVEQSRQLLYGACARLGLQYWPSAGNFVLIRIGEETAGVVRRLAERGVLVRDRSREPGCQDCIRITAGVIEHTRAAIEALEAVCGAH